MIAHHFTVDLEEFFQVAALESRVPRSEWGHFESRLAAPVAQLLDLLASHHAQATFFVLGWVAARQPELIRAIARAGHEIASHGWDHARVTTQSPVQFQVSIRRTKDLLEEITGEPVWGFRAPSFSIVRGREWALDLLINEGYRYDSSLFPVRRPGGGYGYPAGLSDPHWLERPAGGLVEIPPTTLRWCGMRLPAAGGAYFRLLPYGIVQAAFRQSEQRGIPGTFYIHPWELDPAQPRLAVAWHTRVRHYGGLSRTTRQLARLFSEFRFTAVRDTVAAIAASRGRPPEVAAVCA
ncbi:MAG: polysaccharide deacetylase family protein [Gemmatimonadetes bacterium]|nr:MAG: polysaccharide deacetylase family protein [Gemmatimonadota bacterium]